MQILIEISKEMLSALKSGKLKHGSIAEEMIVEAVKDGTPLPKGHGRLIDADEVKKNHEKWIGYIDEDMITRLNIAVDKHIPTIIPADKDD